MKALLPISIVLMLLGAAMLLADVGASGLWIAVIAVGVSMVVIVQRGGRPSHR